MSGCSTYWVNFGHVREHFVPSVAEWSKMPESDASAGGESPVRAPVRAATLCPYAYRVERNYANIFSRPFGMKILR